MAKEKKTKLSIYLLKEGPNSNSYCTTYLKKEVIKSPHNINQFGGFIL